PGPRVAHSRRLQNPPALELIEDLAAEAVAERHVDERENSYQQGKRESDHRYRDQKDRRNRKHNAAHALGKVVRLGSVLHRPRLDHAARLEDLEVEQFEERVWRRNGADQKNDREQWDQRETRLEQRAAPERCEHAAY